MFNILIATAFVDKERGSCGQHAVLAASAPSDNAMVAQARHENKNLTGG
jgi:hypothetical protein